MNDEFLSLLRTKPDPEFVDVLLARLNRLSQDTIERNENVTIVSRANPVRFGMRPALAAISAVVLAGALALAVSPDARASIRDLWERVGGTTFHEQSSPSIIGVTPPPAESGEKSPTGGQPLPAEGSGKPLPYKEAAALHRANGYKLISAVPTGYIAEAMASANAGMPQGISEFRWDDDAGHVLVFGVIVRPAGRNESVFPVGPGALTGIDVDGHGGAYIQGDWDDNGHWDASASSRLVWSERDVDYQISTNDPSLLMGDLLEIAKSAQ